MSSPRQRKNAKRKKVEHYKKAFLEHSNSVHAILEGVGAVPGNKETIITLAKSSLSSAVGLVKFFLVRETVTSDSPQATIPAMFLIILMSISESICHYRMNKLILDAKNKRERQRSTELETKKLPTEELRKILDSEISDTEKRDQLLKALNAIPKEEIKDALQHQHGHSHGGGSDHSIEGAPLSYTDLFWISMHFLSDWSAYTGSFLLIAADWEESFFKSAFITIGAIFSLDGAFAPAATMAESISQTKAEIISALPATQEPASLSCWQRAYSCLPSLSWFRRDTSGERQRLLSPGQETKSLTV